MLLTSRVWDNAVGASLVAAVDDVDPRGNFGLSAGDGDVFVNGGEVSSYHLASLVDLVQEVVDSVGVLGTWSARFGGFAE